MDVLPHRGLTDGERAMLLPIFRDGIDYNAVQIIHAAHPFQPSDAYMAPRGHIYAPGHLFREDWSAPDVSAVSRAELVHEMTHVWQFANGIDVFVEGVEQFISFFEQAGLEREMGLLFVPRAAAVAAQLRHDV